jgi:hypothetical protein
MGDIIDPIPMEDIIVRTNFRAIVGMCVAKSRIRSSLSVVIHSRGVLMGRAIPSAPLFLAAGISLLR